MPTPKPPPTRQTLIVERDVTDNIKINSNRTDNIKLDATRMSSQLLPLHKSKIIETISGSPIFIKIEKHSPIKVISP